MVHLIIAEDSATGDRVTAQRMAEGRRQAEHRQVFAVEEMYGLPSATRDHGIGLERHHGQETRQETDSQSKHVFINHAVGLSPARSNHAIPARSDHVPEFALCGLRDPDPFRHAA